MDTEDHLKFIVDLLTIITDGVDEEQDTINASTVLDKITDRIDEEIKRVSIEQQAWIDKQFNGIIDP
jgi:hypothetical protein